MINHQEVINPYNTFKHIKATKANVSESFALIATFF
jgi:hypothetical protein